jgi:hypothetical protein
MGNLIKTWTKQMWTQINVSLSPLSIFLCEYFTGNKFNQYTMNLKLSEWVSDCCLTPTKQFFSYIICYPEKWQIQENVVPRKMSNTWKSTSQQNEWVLGNISVILCKNMIIWWCCLLCIRPTHLAEFFI